MKEGPFDEVLRLRARVALLEQALGGPTASRRANDAGTDPSHDAATGTWAWDVATNHVYWSEAHYRILGFEPGEVTPTPDVFFSVIHPDDLARVRARSEQVVRGSIGAPMVCRVLRPDGAIRKVRLDSLAVHDDRGQVRRVVGTITDITAGLAAIEHAQRTADMLREAQRIAQVGSWSWDIARDTTDWSDELYRILALPVDASPSLDAIRALLHPADVAGFDALLQQSLSDSSESCTLRVLWPDQTLRHVTMDSSSVRNAAGEVVRVVGTVMDVTDRMLLEEQLRHAQKMEAIGTLAGGVAHDFNNYLLVMRGNCELLELEMDAPPDHAAHQHLVEVNKAIGRCELLTRQLLAFSRRQPAEPRLVDLGELVRNSINMWLRVITDSIEVETVVEPALSSIRVDPVQVDQVIMNLAVNARDAMPDGGRLTITVGNVIIDGDYASQVPRLTPGPHVMLLVQDTGTGMTEEVRGRAFEPFFTTKPQGRGTGLGLSTVYGILRQAGAAITIDSELGCGTTFRIFFPAQADAPELADEGREQTEAVGGRETILVVEDSEQVRDLAVRVLQRAGYRVVAAEHGDAALTLVSSLNHPIDLLLTDVQMPGMGGIELAHHLTARYRDLRVLFMSGYSESSAALRGNGSALLQKPFTRRELLSKLRERLDAPISESLRPVGHPRRAGDT